MFNIAPLCKTTEQQMNLLVVEDVVSQVRDLFLEENVNEEVLEKLKKMWKTKLGITTPPESFNVEEQDPNNSLETSMNVYRLQQQPATNHVRLWTKMVPIEIKVLSQPANCIPERVLSLTVPAYVLQEGQIQKVLTPVIAVAMNHPKAVADNILQQHVNASFGQLREVARRKENPLKHTNKALISVNSVAARKSSSSTEEQAIEKKKPADSPVSSNGPSDSLSDVTASDTQSLNSDDDSSNEDIANDDNTDESIDEQIDNVIVCHYEKIFRKGRMWTIHLKNGVMHLDGEDYMFRDARGSAKF